MVKVDKRPNKIIAPLIILIGFVFSMNVNAEWNYSVRPGDTLWGICKKYAQYPNCWKEIGAHNAIDKPRSLSIGERITMPIEWLKQVPFAAELLYFRGQFKLTDKNAKHYTEGVNVGAKLRFGETIETINGTVTLRFMDGSVLTMHPYSRIELDAASAFTQTRPDNVDIYLSAGTVDINVPKKNKKSKLKVNTPSAVAAVRGTNFSVSSKDFNETKTQVYEGVVDFSAQKQIKSLEAGFGSLAKKGQAPMEPVKLLDAPEWNLSCDDPGYVEWVEVPNTSYYELSVLENDEKIEKRIKQLRIEDNFFWLTDIDDGCYQLKLSAVDTLGLSGNPAKRDFCYEKVLQQPVILESSWKKHRIELDWDDIKGANSYIIQISKSDKFDELVATHKTVNSFFSGELSAKEELLYIRVQASGENVVSAYSSGAEVKHQSKPYWGIGALFAVVAMVLL